MAFAITEMAQNKNNRQMAYMFTGCRYAKDGTWICIVMAYKTVIFLCRQQFGLGFLSFLSPPFQ